MKTIIINRFQNGGVSIGINGAVPRTITNPNDLIVKTLPTGDGVIIKVSDESYRQHVYLADSTTINGDPAPTNLADLVLVLTNNVFSGGTTYATPTKIAQVITFAALTTRAHTAAAFLAGATVDSGLSPTYTSSDPTKATVNATTGLITPVAAGSTDITASQAGNGIYAAASPIIQTLTLT